MFISTETGAPYQQRQTYLLNGNELLELDACIRAIGKSKMGDVFAICVKDRIAKTRGWQGENCCGIYPW